MYFTIASSINDGHILYVDLVTHKTPGIFILISVILQSIGGLLSPLDLILTSRLIVFFTNLAIAGLLYWICQSRWDSIFGEVAVFSYLVAVPIYDGTYILPDTFLTLTSIASLLFVYHYFENKNAIYIFFSGLTLGIGFLFKQPGGFVALAIGLGLIYHKFRNINSIGGSGVFIKTICQGTLLSIGFSIPILMIGIWLMIEGALDEAIFWIISGNSSFGLAAFHTLVRGNIDNIFQLPILWTLAISGIILTGIQITEYNSNVPDNISFDITTIFVLVLSAIPIIVRSRPHYFMIFLPFAILIATRFVYFSKDYLKFLRESRQIRVLLLASLIIFSLPVMVNVGKTTILLLNDNDGLSEQHSNADYLSKEVSPSEQLHIISYQPEYYFLIEHEPYYPNVYYLAANKNITYTEDSLVNSIKTENFDYILIRESCAAQVSNVCDYVRQEYQLVQKRNEYFVLYRHRNTNNSYTR